MRPVDEEKQEEKIEPEVTDYVSSEPQEEIKEEPKKDLAEEYLNLARVIQADFDNYRKRSLVQIENARIDGISSAAEVLLPSIDAFKKVKENVKDEKTLEGIEMLERAILAGFEKLGIEKIEAVGKPLDPNVHNVLAVVNNSEMEDDIVVEEFQAGYKMGDKIIRCSQVLVNKIN